MASFKASFHDGDKFNASFGEVQRMSTSDYEGLYNKPSIEGHELLGDSKLHQIGVNTATIPEIEAILYLD